MYVLSWPAALRISSLSGRSWSQRRPSCTPWFLGSLKDSCRTASPWILLFHLCFPGFGLIARRRSRSNGVARGSFRAAISYRTRSLRCDVKGDPRASAVHTAWGVPIDSNVEELFLCLESVEGPAFRPPFCWTLAFYYTAGFTGIVRPSLMLPHPLS